MRRWWKGGAALVSVLALVMLAAVPAYASDGASPWECGGNATCLGQLYGMVHGGGDYGPGSGTTVINIPPPACAWKAVGAAQPGSEYVVNYYHGTAPAQNAPAQQYQSFQQAKDMIAADDTSPGEWYEFMGASAGDTAAEAAECNGAPKWIFAIPGEALPGVYLAPVTLSELATARLLVPQAGKMYLNPASGTTDVNLPTFVRVELTRQYQIAPNGVPYATDVITLGNAGATVWVEAASKLALTTSDSTAKVQQSGCGYLGSTEMVLDPKEAAKVGANGTVDCGVTFHQPGTWQITASFTWKTCWVPYIVHTPPPAHCVPVPNANLNPVTWVRTVNVHEIQAVNGGTS